MKQTKRVLSVVLALAMVFAMSIMVVAEESDASPACTFDAVKDGDQITVTLYSEGADMATFAYGIAYDKEKLDVVMNADDEAVTWGPAGSVKMADGGIAITGSYVTIGGTHSKDTFPTTKGDVIASVTFKMKGDDMGQIFVGADPATDFAPSAPGTATEIKEEDVKTPAPAPSEEATPAPSEEVPASATPEQSAVAPTQAPTSAAPAQSKAPTATTKAPKTADTASVVIPVVAIVAAAAAVVVVSKKRVEE